MQKFKSEPLPSPQYPITPLSSNFPKPNNNNPMFGFPEDNLFRIEAEYDLHYLDNSFCHVRKNSFIDLLSYEKSTQDSDLEGINIDHYSLDLPAIKICPQDFEQVKLLLDDFPDLTVVQRPKAEVTRKLMETHDQKTEKIGTLTIQERMKKIDRYLEKKKKRTWVKKIHYNCRKRVADKRLRIKGRFVTSNKKK